ncbi:NADH:flavin oxidoreductase [Saccharopolyspora rhizosphaerae]|uniref:NADH:flavin oxidoreductase n=1 Tax=Saccharopolyspora rhizosphaerae TaxID=2492662 RepID=A0A426JWW8_9PSEU|nr:NADH:flavin oxidoreductase [Saccharopolyspora rhizosphaerae]RRO17657.1 NADH:flavin oxidoreductase [Saccharopolyspora rhizosphaerae]
MNTASPQTTAAEDPLFTPAKIGGVALDNRAALAPMTRVSAREDGSVTDRNARYYAGFARGGFGLIITEGTYTDTEHSQGYLDQPGLATADQEASWRPVVEAVHAENSAFFAQLMHAGSQSQGNRFRRETVGPSAVAPRGEQLAFYRGEGPFPTPRPLEKAEIADLRRGFAAAARRAASAGFDGVELHGANGYLIDEFLTDYLNQREDDYGGGVANRVLLAAEICDEVLQAVGSEIAVGIRISQSKVSDAHHRWAGGAEDAEFIFSTLARTGLHFVHTTEYRANAAAFGTGPTLAELAKQHSGLPVIANGQLEDPRTARSLLNSGAADVVAIGKAALAQHDWPQRVQDGRDIAADPHPDVFNPLADIKDWELEL